MESMKRAVPVGLLLSLSHVVEVGDGLVHVAQGDLCPEQHVAVVGVQRTDGPQMGDEGFEQEEGAAEGGTGGRGRQGIVGGKRLCRCGKARGGG